MVLFICRPTVALHQGQAHGNEHEHNLIHRATIMPSLIAIAYVLSDIFVI